ncbi:fructosamine kinase family protein [Flavisericum labens]|uniref:fructosamine kinase family protein n=1 Tax=Flavisericum labens TaxID=3377112 RepID=UPI00387B7CD6
MQTDLKKHLTSILNETITKVSPVHGGDISTSYKVEAEGQSYFLKVNSNPDALDMLKIEASGLKLVENTNTIKTPQVLAYDAFQNTAFLLMEFIEPKQPSSKDLKV